MFLACGAAHSRARNGLENQCGFPVKGDASGVRAPESYGGVQGRKSGPRRRSPMHGEHMYGVHIRSTP